MEHVFVETNWLVGCFAPAHQRIPAALELREKAVRGEVTLYLPGICKVECRRPIREKFQVRAHADSVRKFLSFAGRSGTITDAQTATVRLVLDKMEAAVQRDLDNLDSVLEALGTTPNLQIFHLDEEMLVRTAELSELRLDLQPFDQAILGAVLVQAERLKKQGINRTAFCELDSDLRPWDKVGSEKPILTKLYDDRGVWVYGDFTMHTPLMPPLWPQSKGK